jgi:ankyrin repeat protein
MRRVVLVTVLAAVVFAAGTNKDRWRDSPITTQLWNVISSGNADELKAVLESDDEAVRARSADGRGPLWWAYEYNQPELVKVLLDAGADPNERDGDGKRPQEVTNVGPTEYMASQEQIEPEVPVYDIPDDEDEDEE